MRYPISAISVAAGAALLAGCAQLAGAVQKVEDLTIQQIDDYCASTPESQRLALRDRLTYDDGSPRVVVYCEPHGGGVN